MEYQYSQPQGYKILKTAQSSQVQEGSSRDRQPLQMNYEQMPLVLGNTRRGIYVLQNILYQKSFSLNEWKYFEQQDDISENKNSQTSHPFDLSFLVKSLQCQKSQHRQKQQKYSAIDYHKAIGLVQSTWYNTRRQLEIINYGTGFAISPWLIMTCQHNIFNQKYHLPACQIYFLPGLNGKVDYQNIWKSKQKSFFRAKQLKKGEQSFKLTPTVNQLCLIALQRPLYLTEYIKIGSTQLYKSQQIQIIGYPSKSYIKESKIMDIVPLRQHLKGTIKTATQQIISYDMPTEVGHSGSPILAFNRNGQVVAIGIHTHRGGGLLFTPFVYQMLIEYYQQLKDQQSMCDSRYLQEIDWKEEYLCGIGCELIN